MVVAHYQQSQRLRRFPGNCFFLLWYRKYENLIFIFLILIYIFLGATGFDGYFHARQNSDIENIAHSNIQSSLVAESARVYRHGFMSSKFNFLKSLFSILKFGLLTIFEF